MQSFAVQILHHANIKASSFLYAVDINTLSSICEDILDFDQGFP